MTIFVTTGPGPKSGIDKTSVGTASTGPCYPTRSFTDDAKAEGLVADLHRRYPNAQIVRRSR